MQTLTDRERVPYHVRAGSNSRQASCIAAPPAASTVPTGIRDQVHPRRHGPPEGASCLRDPYRRAHAGVPRLLASGHFSWRSEARGGRAAMHVIRQLVLLCRGTTSADLSHFHRHKVKRCSRSRGSWSGSKPRLPKFSYSMPFSRPSLKLECWRQRMTEAPMMAGGRLWRRPLGTLRRRSG